MLASVAMARNLAQNQNPPTAITMPSTMRMVPLASNCLPIRRSRSSSKSL